MWKAKPKSLDDVYEEYGCYFRVDFGISKLAERVEDEMACCDNIKGKVIKVKDRGEDSGREIEVGYIELMLFKLGPAMNYRLDFFELFDSQEADTGQLYSAIFDGDSRDLKESIEEEYCPDAVVTKVLHIHKLELEPDCRGFGLGENVAMRAIETFSDYGTIITTKPFALQWAGKGENISEQMKSDMEKVLKFWESVGFERIEESDFFIFSD